MDSEQLQRLKNKVRAKHMAAMQADLDAIDRVWAMAVDLGEPVQDSAQAANPERRELFSSLEPQSDQSTPQATEKGFVLRAVSEVVPLMEGEFSWFEVMDKLALEKPGVQFNIISVRQAVQRLVETGVVEVVEQGKGRKRSVYRVAK